MDKSLGFLISRAAITIKKEFLRRLKPYDITPEQWSVLNRLGEEDGRTQKDLAERTFKDQPNTARILDKLEKKKLVMRADNPDDRRAFLIYLTEKGKEVRESIVPISAQLNDEISLGLTRKERDQFIVFLNKTYENMDQDGKELC